MVFLSPLGLGARLIGRRRRRRPRRKAHVKFDVISKTRNKFGSVFQLKPHGQKRKKNEEEKSIGSGEVTVVSDTFSSSSSHLNDDDVVREILSRLPVKSLMRFKCVCKYWLFLIQQDPSFIHLHLERSRTRPALFITNLTDNEDRDNKEIFMTANLSFQGSGGTVSSASVHTIRGIRFTCEEITHGPLNGLVAFFSPNITYGVCIYNLSTGEATPRLKSTLLSKLSRCPNPQPLTSCGFGYDPATKEHKVVGVWRTTSFHPRYVVCEVLTVGDNEWRKIDEVPPYDLGTGRSSVCLNGSIYFITTNLRVWTHHNKNRPNFIVAFDVGSEKFRAITVPPSFISHLPSGEANAVFPYIQIFELDGRVALFVEVAESVHSSKLWLFDETKNKDNTWSAWTEVLMELPVSGPFNPVLGTDLIIISHFDKSSNDATCYSYNWKTKSFHKFQISGIPSSVPPFSAYSKVKPFSESLLSVRKQTSSTSSKELKTIS